MTLPCLVTPLCNAAAEPDACFRQQSERRREVRGGTNLLMLTCDDAMAAQVQDPINVHDVPSGLTRPREILCLACVYTFTRASEPKQ